MSKNIEEIKNTLSKLIGILNTENERNWIRGIKSALSHIEVRTEEDYRLARSIYKTMCNGSAGFMEYSIKRDAFEEQSKSNAQLDQARDKLWDLFEL